MKADKDVKAIAVLVILLIVAAFGWIDEYNARRSAEKRADAAERALMLQRGE